MTYDTEIMKDKKTGTSKTLIKDADKQWNLTSDDALNKVASDKIFDVNTKMAFKK